MWDFSPPPARTWSPPSSRIISKRSLSTNSSGIHMLMSCHIFLQKGGNPKNIGIKYEYNFHKHVLGASDPHRTVPCNKIISSVGWRLLVTFSIPSGNLTQLWKITIFYGQINYKWAIFHSYVKLPEATSKVQQIHKLTQLSRKIPPKSSVLEHGRILGEGFELGLPKRWAEDVALDQSVLGKELPGMVSNWWHVFCRWHWWPILGYPKFLVPKCSAKKNMSTIEKHHDLHHSKISGTRSSWIR